jgi:spermidine synthase
VRRRLDPLAGEPSSLECNKPKPTPMASDFAVDEPARGESLRTPPKGLGFAYALAGGFALVYQLAWYHGFVDQLGAQGTTFVLVLCGFIGGLGAGALASPAVFGWLERRTGERGLRNYGRIEMLVALSVMLLHALSGLSLGNLLGSFPWSSTAIEGVAYFRPSLSSSILELGLALIAVGVPSFLMGTTFPYLCSLFPADPRLPSRLYAANTLGASLAVLGTEFLGITRLGWLGCLSAAVLGNLALGLWFWRLPPEMSRMRSADKERGADIDGIPSNLPAVASGWLCGGVEALAFAFVRLTIGASRAEYAFLTFFAILGIFAASTLVHRLRLTRRVLLAGGYVGLFAAIVTWLVEPRISVEIVLFGIFKLASLDPDVAAFLVCALTMAVVVLVPYACWSTFLPDLCDRLQAKGRSVARTCGLNTLAFLLAVLLFGWVLPNVNFFFAARVFVLSAVAALLLIAVDTEQTQRRAKVSAVVFAAGLSIGGFFVVSRLPEMRLLGGLSAAEKRVEAWRGTPQHFIWVRPNPDQSKSLMFDQHPMSAAGKPAQTYMRAMAHLPLLLHEAPRKALLICFGVGATADAIRLHPSIERLDVVDLNPTVFALNRYFERFNGRVLDDRRIRLFGADGRRFLRLSHDTYDFVTMEPPPPLEPGISRLYSGEYYAAVKARLSPGGMVSQWAPEYQYDEEANRLVIDTFVRAFPETLLFVGYGRELILVGSDRPFDFGRLARNWKQSPAVARDLARFGFDGPARLLSTIMRLSGGLRRDFGEGPIIEDGFASLEAIQLNYTVQSQHPRSRFGKFKGGLFFDPEEVLGALRATAPAQVDDVARSFVDPLADAKRLGVPFWYFRGRPTPPGLAGPNNW